LFRSIRPDGIEPAAAWRARSPGVVAAVSAASFSGERTPPACPVRLPAEPTQTKTSQSSRSRGHHRQHASRVCSQQIPDITLQRFNASLARHSLGDGGTQRQPLSAPLPLSSCRHQAQSARSPLPENKG
jgi:hypothetical protein